MSAHDGGSGADQDCFPVMDDVRRNLLGSGEDAIEAAISLVRDELAEAYQRLVADVVLEQVEVDARYDSEHLLTDPVTPDSSASMTEARQGQVASSATVVRSVTSEGGTSAGRPANRLVGSPAVDSGTRAIDNQEARSADPSTVARSSESHVDRSTIFLDAPRSAAKSARLGPDQEPTESRPDAAEEIEKQGSSGQEGSTTQTLGPGETLDVRPSAIGPPDSPSAAAIVSGLRRSSEIRWTDVMNAVVLELNRRQQDIPESARLSLPSLTRVQEIYSELSAQGGTFTTGVWHTKSLADRIVTTYLSPRDPQGLPGGSPAARGHHHRDSSLVIPYGPSARGAGRTGQALAGGAQEYPGPAGGSHSIGDGQPSHPSEVLYATQLAHVLGGTGPVDTQGALALLRRRNSTPELHMERPFRETFQQRGGTTLRDALNRAVEAHRLDPEAGLAIARAAHLSETPPADEVPWHTVVAPQTAHWRLPHVVETARGLQHSVRAGDVRGTLEALRRLGNDQRRIWSVSQAWSERYGSDMRSSMLAAWPHAAGLLSDALGHSDRGTVSFEQASAWHRRLATMSWPHYRYGAVPLTTQYPDTGCFTRAHIWSLQLMRWGALPRRAFVANASNGLSISTPYARGATNQRPLPVTWDMHTAPVVNVLGPGGTVSAMVLDPVISRAPLPIDDWARSVGATGSVLRFHGPLEQVHAQIRSHQTQNPSAWRFRDHMLPTQTTVVLTDGHAHTFPFPDLVPHTSWQQTDAHVRADEDVLYRHAIIASRRRLARGMWDLLSGFPRGASRTQLTSQLLALIAHAGSPPGLLQDNTQLSNTLRQVLGHHFAQIAAALPAAPDGAVTEEESDEFSSEEDDLSGSDGDSPPILSARTPVRDVMGGGSRDALLDPLEEGWAPGRAVTLSSPRRVDGSGAVASQQLTSVLSPLARGHITGAVRLSGTYPFRSTGYSFVVDNESIAVTDEWVVPVAGWQPFGADFVHLGAGAYLRGDSGWIGRLANHQEVSDLLMEQNADTAPRYTFTVGADAVHLVPDDDSNIAFTLSGLMASPNSTIDAQADPSSAATAPEPTGSPSRHGETLVLDLAELLEGSLDDGTNLHAAGTRAQEIIINRLRHMTADPRRTRIEVHAVSQHPERTVRLLSEIVEGLNLSIYASLYAGSPPIHMCPGP